MHICSSSKRVISRQTRFSSSGGRRSIQSMKLIELNDPVAIVAEVDRAACARLSLKTARRSASWRVIWAARWAKTTVANGLALASSIVGIVVEQLGDREAQSELGAHQARRRRCPAARRRARHRGWRSWRPGADTGRRAGRGSGTSARRRARLAGSAPPGESGPRCPDRARPQRIAPPDLDQLVRRPARQTRPRGRFAGIPYPATGSRATNRSPRERPGRRRRAPPPGRGRASSVSQRESIKLASAGQ